MTDAPELNVPLFRKALEWVNAEAEKPSDNREWYQGNWRTVRSDTWVDILAENNIHRCGTTYCIAGYVAEVCGATWNGDTPLIHTSRGITDPSDFAAEQLGLSDAEAALLFLGGNDITDVNQVAHDICEARGLKLEELLG